MYKYTPDRADLQRKKKRVPKLKYRLSTIYIYIFFFNQSISKLYKNIYILIDVSPHVLYYNIL